MRTVVAGPRPPELEALLQRRRAVLRLGHGRHAERESSALLGVSSAVLATKIEW